MSDNPYAPPGSRVEDLSVSGSQAERPPQVVIAIRLAVLNYGLGLVSIAASWEYFSKLQSPGEMLVNQLFSVALLVWIYYKIHIGRNWARIVLLVLCVFGVLMLIGSTVLNLLAAAPTVVKVQMAVGVALNLVVLWLLFFSAGRHWFRRPATRLAA